MADHIIPGVKIQPYVGPKYREQDQRVLVVGESHYDSPEKSKEFNQSDKPIPYSDWVLDIYLNKKAMRFFTSVGRVLTCREAGFAQQNKDLWERIAFCNFLQFILEYEQRPDHSQLEASKPAFPLVVKDLKPTHIFIFSMLGGRSIPLGLKDGEFGEREFDGWKAQVLQVWHPAAVGFAAPKYFETVKEFLDHPILESQDPAQAGD